VEEGICPNLPGVFYWGACEGGKHDLPVAKSRSRSTSYTNALIYNKASMKYGGRLAANSGTKNRVPPGCQKPQVVAAGAKRDLTNADEIVYLGIFGASSGFGNRFFFQLLY
jgi:hypothetical protein